jgi:non-ribosomal peptide synthetase component F
MIWTDAWTKQSHDHPHNVALLNHGSTVLYGELFSQAKSLVQCWKKLGVQRGDRVVVEYDSGREWIEAVWACGLMGLVWSPCPPQVPALRRDIWIEKSDPSLIVGPSGTRKRMSQDPCDDKAAYLIATSGSTGEPKGVLVGHEGIEPMLQAQREAFGVSEKTVAWWVISPAFDASVSDVGTVLGAGGVLLITSGNHWRKESTFRSIAHKHQVNLIDASPAWLARQRLMPPSLQTIVAGGEPTPPSVIDRWSGQLRWINVYGPTETTVCSSLEQKHPGQHRPTIGQPIAENIFCVGHPLSPQDEGELWIGGSGVALGYWKDPDLTAQKFVNVLDKKWFRTGDKVKAHGSTWEFLGRMDRQVKIRGQLLDLNEVELVLLGVLGVAETCVWIEDEKLIVAWAAVDPQMEDQVKQVMMAHAKLRLPSWGVPQKWWTPRPWPRTLSGKSDKQALLKCGKTDEKTLGQLLFCGFFAVSCE